MRLTERRETPARRATSALECPAFNRISTSCRFSIPNILLPPPIRFTDRGHRESSSLSGYRWACQNFRNEECQIFRNRQAAPKPTKTEFYCRDANGELVEAGLYFDKLYERLLADPAWHAEQERKL